MGFSDLVGEPIGESEVASVLARDGVVLFTGGSRDQLSELLHDLAEVRLHPHGSRRGETVVEPRAASRLAGGAGFSRLALPPHTDRAIVPRPPAVVAVLIEQAAAQGGQSLLADARALLVTAEPSFRSLVLDAGSAGTYPVFEVRAGLGRIRYRDDALARPRATLGHDAIALAALRALTTRPVALTLAAGDGYLVHNHRVLHGRTAFRGYRRATRFLADIRSGDPYAWMNDGFRLGNEVTGGSNGGTTEHNQGEGSGPRDG
jgi:alpha-ketoglutarate-dependent taurine dioxygenase